MDAEYFGDEQAKEQLDARVAAAMPIIEVWVPDDLAERDRWGVWRREIVKGHEAKVPYSARGFRADTTNPNDWGAFEVARRAMQAGRYTGLAFAFFADDGFVGIDVDDCLDANGTPKAWARSTIEQFSDTYMEVSPSGAGIKIWTRGKLPANVPGVKIDDGAIEMYDHGRYFTVTGQVFRSAPLQVEEHAADVLALYEHLTARKRKTWALQPPPNGRIPHGQQHSTLVSIAGTLRARRVWDPAIEACLLVINAQQCEQPGPPEHIKRLVASTRRWGAA